MALRPTWAVEQTNGSLLINLNSITPGCYCSARINRSSDVTPRSICTVSNLQCYDYRIYIRSSINSIHGMGSLHVCYRQDALGVEQTNRTRVECSSTWKWAGRLAHFF